MRIFFTCQLLAILVFSIVIQSCGPKVMLGHTITLLHRLSLTVEAGGYGPEYSTTITLVDSKGKERKIVDRHTDAFLYGLFVKEDGESIFLCTCNLYAGYKIYRISAESLEHDEIYLIRDGYRMKEPSIGKQCIQKCESTFDRDLASKIELLDD